MTSVEYRHLPTEELLDRARSSADTIGDGDSEEYCDLVSALHRRPERAVFDQATAWCGSAQASRRALGADILGQLGAGLHQPWPWPFAAESTPTLMRLLADSTSQVVASALIALGHLEAAETDEIAGLASHPSSEVRHAVAFALGGRDDPVSLDTLAKLIDDEDRDVRDWAAFALGTLAEADTPELRDALAKRLSDDDREIRGEAMLGLARRSDTRAIAAIVRELETEDVLCLAIEAAVHLTSPQFLPHLERLLERYPDDGEIQTALKRCRAESE